MDQGLTTVLQIITSILAVGALAVSVYKSRGEVSAAGGNSAKSYAETAQIYSDQVRQLRAELELLDKRHADQIKQVFADRDASISELRRRLDGLQLQIADLLVKNDKLSRWAEALVKQVIAMGGVPVICDE